MDKSNQESDALAMKAPRSRAPLIVIGIVLIAVAIVGNLSSIQAQQREAYAVAATTSDAAYHNCVVIRAMARWADNLGVLERAQTWPPADRRYHRLRAKTFGQLKQTLLRVNGVPCTSQLYGQHTHVEDNKRK